MQQDPFQVSLHRRSIRLPGHDYSEAGSYFVTLVTHQRVHLFGEVVDEVVHLSSEGMIVQSICEQLSIRFPQIELDYYVIMPNHFHAIISVKPIEPMIETDKPDLVRAIHELPLRGSDQPERLSNEEDASFSDKESIRKTRRVMLLPKVIGYLKMNSAKQINLLRQSPGAAVWLRNYYEHIIMSDDEYASIWEYIRFNPMNWNTNDEYR